MNEADSRIETLEIKVAHLERAAQELSDVIYRQQQQLDALTSLNRQLVSQLESLEGKTAEPNRVEIPPHY
jgi:SlyX protein